MPLPASSASPASPLVSGSSRKHTKQQNGKRRGQQSSLESHKSPTGVAAAGSATNKKVKLQLNPINKPNQHNNNNNIDRTEGEAKVFLDRKQAVMMVGPSSGGPAPTRTFIDPYADDDDLPGPPIVSNTQKKKLKVRQWMSVHRSKFGGASFNSRNPVLTPDQIRMVDEEREKVIANSSLVKVHSSREPTKALAIDCEMVGTGERGCRNMLARVSIVNAFGHVLIDKFVKPISPVTDYRTFVSGIYPHNLNQGVSFSEIQQEVCHLLKGRVLVGHAVLNDLKVLYLEHPRCDIRDTSKFFHSSAYGGHGTPSLKKLAEHYIGIDIQGDSHDSVEDARATMRLYTMFKIKWETAIAKRKKERLLKGQPEEESESDMEQE